MKILEFGIKHYFFYRLSVELTTLFDLFVKLTNI